MKIMKTIYDGGNCKTFRLRRVRGLFARIFRTRRRGRLRSHVFCNYYDGKAKTALIFKGGRI